MRVNLPFIVCFYIEISEDSSLAPFEVAFISSKENSEISFFSWTVLQPNSVKALQAKERGGEAQRREPQQTER